MSFKTSLENALKVQKRNGQTVAFNSARIRNAVGNAFKQLHGYPREATVPDQTINDVDLVTEKVIKVIKDRTDQGEAVTVETIQDEVIRQLYENGYKDVAQVYASYRKQHAARRSLFELYKTIKRDGRVVSFKPEKINMAVAKALHAHYGDAMTDAHLEKSCEITDAIVADIRTQWSGGKAVHIEEIQDLVEKELMAAGMHEVAKRYILYREEHNQARQSKPASEKEQNYAWVNNLRFKADNGELKQLNAEELHFTIDTCCQGLTGVDSELILKESAKNYYDGINQDELGQSNIMAAKAFLELEPNYSFVAARLLLLTQYREAIGKDISFEGIKTAYGVYFKKYLKLAIDQELLNPELMTFDIDRLSKAIDAKRDFQFKYMGLQTLYDRYFIHSDGRRIELPQIFWMRVSMGLALKEGAQKNERAIEFYNILSGFRFTSSTPTLFNSGTLHSQLSSCFLTTISDDLNHIFKCIQDDAMLSKWSGGLGNDWTNVRSLGSRIKGTNGKSQGIIPFLKVANDTALAVNQGGKRQGAMCAYLEVWHHDIEEFLELRKNTGDDRRRTHDMHTANWIPDLFMKRVKENANWSLFSPNEASDLHHLYGSKFEKRYEEYEQMGAAGELKQYKSIPAVQLWRKMLSMLFETGHPWITFKDPSNIRSPQDHTGVVHSSNLCTEILLNTSEDETAVCNLGSINLAVHTTEEGLDHKLLEETIHSAVRMLDNVIDINYYPTVEAKAANQRHRPVGLGLMGFQDALFQQNISYSSQQGVDFADLSMEAISFYAIKASIELAKEKGPYSSYKDSKWDRGLIPYDTIQLLEDERGGYLDVDRGHRMDWTPIREALKKYGMRNSNVMAIAPTATIANIIGVTSSIEPVYKNIFVKSNLSGEFTVVNEFLVKDLKSLNLWDEEMIDDLKYFDGSIQEIERIPDELKQKYATAFEIDYEWIIESASRRQKWIDMGQSLNLYQAKPSGKKISDMYLFGWEKGLKTTYYLRSMGATRIEKSTLDITKAKYINNIVGGRNTDETAPAELIKTKAVSNLSIEPTEDCEACQ